MNSAVKTAALCAALIAASAIAGAQTISPKGSLTGPVHFPEQSGAALYKAICQGCHMPDAKGATGAAAYPALANNAKLAAAGYPILRVLYGQGAMPGLRWQLDDQQVADVVTYVRSNFGNAYADKIAASDVKALRRDEAPPTGAH